MGYGPSDFVHIMRARACMYQNACMPPPILVCGAIDLPRQVKIMYLIKTACGVFPSIMELFDALFSFASHFPFPDRQAILRFSDSGISKGRSKFGQRHVAKIGHITPFM